ncbi:DgyrCDS14454 [Dimorphilus gyrociliatus]|uniref:DgyrCDS14454 n=1 Tax=Dimorphilus gyrociliatus TaxID=2664684 RepID=A0A7I8WDY9_9ANNE|nr:DgyrCDS14454 [Dimorphilus gyrociliatus]
MTDAMAALLIFSFNFKMAKLISMKTFIRFCQRLTKLFRQKMNKYETLFVIIIIVLFGLSAKEVLTNLDFEDDIDDDNNNDLCTESYRNCALKLTDKSHIFNIEKSCKILREMNVCMATVKPIICQVKGLAMDLMTDTTNLICAPGCRKHLSKLDGLDTRYCSIHDKQREQIKKCGLHQLIINPNVNIQHLLKTLFKV